MGKFKVVSIYTRNGLIERREIKYFETVVDAFTYWGYQCAVSNGAIIMTADDNAVWAEHGPVQLETVTDEQVKKYHLFRDEDYRKAAAA